MILKCQSLNLKIGGEKKELHMVNIFLKKIACFAIQPIHQQKTMIEILYAVGIVILGIVVLYVWEMTNRDYTFKVERYFTMQRQTDNYESY